MKKDIYSKNYITNDYFIMDLKQIVVIYVSCKYRSVAQLVRARA